MSTDNNQYNDTDIAIVGMACRLPGARNITEFWDVLVNGRETISEISDELLQRGEYDFESIRNDPNYVRARGILEDIDKFDASFFGCTPKEASALDPQHRIWFETA